MSYEFERANYSEGPLTAVWPSQISARRFINAIEDPSDPTNYNTIEQPIVVPPHGHVEVWYDPIDNPVLNDSFDIWTATGKTGTQFTKVTGSSTLGVYDVRVYPMQPSWLDFNTARAGETVYVTVKSAYSRVTATSLERLYTEISAMGSSTASTMGKMIVAGEDIPADCFVRIGYSSGLKIYKAAAVDEGTLAAGYCPNAISSGATGWVQFIGEVSTLTTRRTPPVCTRLYLSIAYGYCTWTADTDEVYKLVSGSSLVQYVGFHLASGAGYINTIANPSMGVAP